MNSGKLKELAALRAKIVALEQSIASELNRELASLPAKYGYASTSDFVAAVQAATGKRRGRKPGKSAGVAASPGKQRRKRAKNTDETRADVKKRVGAGKTGGEIAKALGISLPSVQNIKKALGLVKKKK